MSRLALRVIAVAGVIALLGVGSYAIAGGGSRNFSGSPLTGYEENPDLSTTGNGSFTARLSSDGSSIHYKLSYSGLEGTVTQSHVHFGKTAINAGISFWLCETATNPSPTASTPACPMPGGTVEGDITAAEVIGPAGQGIAAGELAEILAAMRAGHAYANVHSSKYPGGEIRAQIDTGRGEHDDDDEDDD
jgi:CHRD domain-containing protein